eukprot:TRINITY_DN740_c0_g1_i1.p1 TRINITY_DN740_c0_g1~~TRINITY_DN740_c0_g1_i1.p1  ORF type:complete len:160 (+),score=32.76 TRINITY_DN740_c0_g1_i1:68-481(+)
MASEANREAFVELQGRLLDTDRRLKQVLSQERAKEAEKKRAVLTLQELQALPNDAPSYRAVGRAFIVEPLSVLMAEHEKQVQDCDSSLKKLQGTKEYVEKAMQEVQSNFRELLKQAPLLARSLSPSTSSPGEENVSV